MTDEVTSNIPAAEESTSPAAKQSRWSLIRALMWVHFLFLLSLPVLALVSMAVLDVGTPGLVAMISFAPVAVYLMALESSYRMPKSLPRALLVAGLVPAQIGLSVALSGRGIWVFFLEEAAVEVGAIMVALMLVMIVSRPTGIHGAVVGVLLVLSVGYGFVYPVVLAYREPGIWILLFISAFLSAVWSLVQVFAPAARKFLDGGGPQNVTLEYDGGRLGRLLDPTHRGETISPGVPEFGTFAPFFAAWFVVGFAASIIGDLIRK